MVAEQALNTILNTDSKVKILRLFISRREDFVASGRQIGRLINITAPAAHGALKDLYNQDILTREIIGKQHLYQMNMKNRMVKDILFPAFRKELSLKEDICSFLVKELRINKIRSKISSILLYGSFQTGDSHEGSDVDIAVVIRSDVEKKLIEKVFTENIANKFSDYFGFHLDVYLKSEEEFLKRFKNNLPPVSTLKRSYSVIYGKDPIEFK